MSNKVISYTGGQIRTMYSTMRRKALFLRLVVYMAILAAIMLFIRDEMSFLLLFIAGICILALEGHLWSMARKAQDKRNAIKVRLFQHKRDLNNIVPDSDGINSDIVKTTYVMNSEGYAMTPGDITRKVIEMKNAINLTNKVKAHRLKNEIAKSVKGISKSELVRMAKELDFDQTMYEVEDLLLEKVNTEHPDKSRPVLKNVQYAELIGTSHPELVAEAARLGMETTFEHGRVGNAVGIPLAIFSYEGKSIFAADDEGSLYLPKGMRWMDATQADVNEILDDMKKLATP